jgi:hypothetical protein
MFIVYPGSRIQIFHPGSRIQFFHPGSRIRIRIKEFLNSRKYDIHPGSEMFRIRNVGSQDGTQQQRL